MTRPSRSFRDRLTLLVAAVLLAAGVGVVAIQYAVLAGVLRSEVRAVSEGGARPVGVGLDPPPEAVRLDDAALVGIGGLSDAVLGRMLISSAALILAVVLLAVLVSRWLVGRLLSRVRDVTEQARLVSAGDLSRRLSLPGPQDEIRELGDTFDDMLGRLEVSFRQQERFVANASHELRTPLAANRLALEGPLAQGRFPADVEPAVLRALEANRRSGHILNALLQLARLPGRIPDPSPVDLRAVVDDVVAARQPGAQARAVRVVVDAPGPVEGCGEATLLARAVDNLVENAVKYSPTGAEVTVTLGMRGGAAWLRVGNPGPQFTAEQAEQLREAFHRGQRNRAAEPGSGLGLTLVDSIARAHGGELRLAPRDGGGLVAELVMPGPCPVDPASDAAPSGQEPRPWSSVCGGERLHHGDPPGGS